MGKMEQVTFLSALTFPLGGLIAYFLGHSVDIQIFIALGVGNFLYIAAAGLIPEVKRAEQFRETLLRFAFFLMGVVLLYTASTAR